MVLASQGIVAGNASLYKLLYPNSSVIEVYFNYLMVNVVVHFESFCLGARGISASWCIINSILYIYSAIASMILLGTF